MIDATAMTAVWFAGWCAEVLTVGWLLDVEAALVCVAAAMLGIDVADSPGAVTGLVEPPATEPAVVVVAGIPEAVVLFGRKGLSAVLVLEESFV